MLGSVTQEITITMLLEKVISYLAAMETILSFLYPPTEFSLSLIIWSTNSFVFFGMFSLTLWEAGGPDAMSLLSNVAARFMIFTIRPPPSGKTSVFHRV